MKITKSQLKQIIKEELESVKIHERKAKAGEEYGDFVVVKTVDGGTAAVRKDVYKYFGPISTILPTDTLMNALEQAMKKNNIPLDIVGSGVGRIGADSGGRFTFKFSVDLEPAKLPAPEEK